MLRGADAEPKSISPASPIMGCALRSLARIAAWLIGGPAGAIFEGGATGSPSGVAARNFSATEARARGSENVALFARPRTPDAIPRPAAPTVASRIPLRVKGLLPIT